MNIKTKSMYANYLHLAAQRQLSFNAADIIIWTCNDLPYVVQISPSTTIVQNDDIILRIASDLQIHWYVL